MAFSPTGKRVALTIVSATITALNRTVIDPLHPTTPPVGWRPAYRAHAGGTWYLLVSAPVAGEATLYESVDGGQTPWATSSLTSGAARGLPLFDLAFRPSDGAPVVLSADGTTPGLPVGSPNTGAWSAGRAHWFSAAGLAVCVGLDALGVPRLVTTDGTAAVVDRSAQIPAGLFAGATEWFIAAAGFVNAPLVIATNGSGRVLVTAAGGTYVEHAIPLDAGYTLTGLAPGEGGFTAIATNGTTTKFYSSVDGASWAFAGDLAGTPATVGPPDFIAVTTLSGQTVL